MKLSIGVVLLGILLGAVLVCRMMVASVDAERGPNWRQRWADAERWEREDLIKDQVASWRAEKIRRGEK